MSDIPYYVIFGVGSQFRACDYFVINVICNYCAIEEGDGVFNIMDEDKAWYDNKLNQMQKSCHLHYKWDAF